MNNPVKTDKMDILLYAAMAAADSSDFASVLSASDIPQMQLSPRADRRIWKRLNRETDRAGAQTRSHPVKELLKCAALIFLIITSVGFTCMMGVEAVRSAVWEFLTQWYETKIAVQITTEHDIPLLTEILEYKEPVVDSDFKRKEILKNATGYVIEYENTTEMIIYKQRVLDDYNTLLSNENTDMYEIEINQYDGIYTIFETHSVTVITILWHDGQYAYSISGNNLNLETLLSIAQSVQ
ncbi:MAG: DUF4367 domain-containing protein [Ruminococcaceae bacterium]|nr:DUF4367 domain-containing protein [Oscillospiraceae bacterium]